MDGHYFKYKFCLFIRKPVYLYSDMNTGKTYKVAGHLFEIRMNSRDSLWNRMDEPFGQFEHDAGASDLLFSIGILESICRNQDADQVYSNADSTEPGQMRLDAFKSRDGYYFEFTQPSSKEANGRLSISGDFRKAECALYGNEIERWLTFNTAVNFCFLLASACHDTAFVHASAVTYKGKAYLFLGKSGTGKSTHSRMWLNALDGVVLMNDDHPIIRIDEDGKAIAYGSPWSGKTHCYKNMHAPIGGIIRIARAPYNKAHRLHIVESYASLMTSISGMTWERNLADGKDRTIQKIIASVPCWRMECLPDEDAARVCSQAVTEVWA